MSPSIGDHPDYLHLKNNRQREYGAITKLFLDMEGSTRLGLLLLPVHFVDEATRKDADWESPTRSGRRSYKLYGSALGV